MAQEQAPRFVTVAEVADLMRVSKMTVYRMIHAGDIPAVRVGKSFRVPTAAVGTLNDLPDVYKRQLVTPRILPPDRRPVPGQVPQFRWG